MFRDDRLIQRAILAFALGSGLVGDIVMAINTARGGPFIDFNVFWTVARVDPHIVYNVDLLTQAQHLITRPEAGPRPFAYPPSAIPWLSVFGLLPYWLALTAWTTAGVTLFAVAASRLFRPTGALLALFSPLAFLVALAGQLTFFVTAALVTTISFVRTKPVFAGVLIGVAATVKPQAVALAPLALVAGGHWKALAACLVTGLGIGLACVALQGPELWAAWLAAVPNFLQIVASPDFIRPGLTPSALAGALGLDGPGRLGMMVAGSGLGVATVWTVFRRSEEPATRIAALVCGSLLCLPYALNYELAALAPAAAAMMLDRNAGRLTWIAAAVAFSGFGGPVAVIVLAGVLLWKSRAAQAPVPAPVTAA